VTTIVKLNESSSLGCSIEMPSARRAPRGTAKPRWGWSGVGTLCAPPLPDEELARIVKLLPVQLVASEEIKTKILALGEKYHRYLHQDEFGPTRAERMSALRMVLGQLELLDSLVLELPQHLALDLTSNSEKQNQSYSFGILYSWCILRSWTIGQIHHAASLELCERDTQHSADDLNILEKICTTAKAAIGLIAGLDTNSEGDLLTDAVCTTLLIVKNAQGAYEFSIGAAPLGDLKRQFCLTIDRLRRRRGPEKHLSLRWLVGELCDLWTEATGKSVTNSAFRNGRYTGCPESPAGRFVLAIVEVLQPSEPWISQNLRVDATVRARIFAASADRARTVSSVMRAYVADKPRSGARRGRPRAWQ
jgi:hypothetical protein